MLPFKIIDDMQEKATIIQLAAQNGGISRATLMEIFNMDSISEENRTLQEAKKQVEQSLELEEYRNNVSNSIEARAKAQANMQGGSFNQLNQQALLQEADAQANQLMQMDDGQRKSMMDEMSKTNYILYSVVRARIDMAQSKQPRQQQQQQQQ
jgi:hypothetical protein